jgi:MFS family permease
MSTVPHSTPSTPSVSASSPFDVPAFRALLWAQACFGVAYSTFLILPKFLAVHLGAGPAQVGWIMATASLANVLTVRPVALVAAHWGPRRTLALASLCMAAGALGFTAVSSVGPLAFFCRVLQGMGWAFMFSASGSLVLALAPPGRLSQAIALHGSANLLSNAIGPALAELGIAVLGPAPVFATAAAVAVLGAWLCSRIQVDPSIRPVPAPGPRPDVRDSLPRFLLFVGVAVGIGSGTMLTFHQPLALARGIHRISDFLVAYTVGAVGVRLAFGNVIDRVGARRVASGSFILYGAIIAAMVAMRPGSLAIYGALFGVAHGLFWPSFLALALQTAPALIQARTLAWVNASYNAGVVSVAALGIVAEHAGFALVFVPVGLLVTATGLALRRR